MDLFHHKLLAEGVQIDGVILEWHAGSRAGTTRLVVGFQPAGGERVEFSQSITDYVEVPAHTLRERLSPDVVPLSLLEGERIPVRYDADKPSHAIIDEPEIHRRALEDHQRGQQETRRMAEEKLEQPAPVIGAPAPAASVEGPGKAMHDKIELLEELADLHAKGGLTDEEFAAEKRKLLGD
jgi:hypothetical protein